MPDVLEKQLEGENDEDDNEKGDEAAKKSDEKSESVELQNLHAKDINVINVDRNKENDQDKHDNEK